MPDLDYTLWTVLMGGVITGVLSGLLGVFALLRKQSLLGDTISHAALPGVALTFLILRIKHPLALVLGAMAAGWIGTLFILWVIRNSKLKEDSVMAVVLAVFFGFGLVLLSLIQKLPTANQAGLAKFLYGSAATMMRRDVSVMAIFAAISLAVLFMFWKEFKLATFDPDFASSLGFPVRLLDVLMLSVIVIAITIGLQSVGVVLMSAMLVAPAAAARQWTDRLLWMALISAFFGMAASAGGALLSSTVPKLPTGPTTVLFITGLVIFSLLFAPARGLVWRQLRKNRNRGELALARLLEQLLWLSKSHQDPGYAHEISLVQSLFQEKISGYLRTLQNRGMVRVIPGGFVSLTHKGSLKAEDLSMRTFDSNGDYK